MRKPKQPPDFDASRAALIQDPEKSAKLMKAIARGALAGGKYLHWDELRHYPPPENLTHQEWWLALKLGRIALYKPIPLLDPSGKPFRFLITDHALERLSLIDQGAGGIIQMPEQVTNPETRDQYYVSSLIQEAITSSQLEGATTTRQIAKEMILTARPPRDRSEQMILNNFRTMERINKWKDQALTKEMVFEIHSEITRDTFSEPTASGRFRHEDEDIKVVDENNEVFYTSPPASQLEERMAALCSFANGNGSGPYIHPVVRSIILHFWLSYDHPFCDGNGRTARALFYWSMLRQKYWLFEFISISQILRNAPAQYSRAFLYTETDDNDLTYFILYNLDVIRRAIDALHDYVAHKIQQVQLVEAKMRGLAFLNPRQRALIAHALRHPNQLYTIEAHRRSHNVVYQTARTDLLALKKQGLFQIIKAGRTMYFKPVEDLERRLSELSA